MAFLSGYTTRRPDTVTNSVATTLTDYQVKVTLTSINFDFTKANADGSDIRFTSSDGTTELSYWIESYNNTTSNATIWVKVPSVAPSTTTTIYIYYGNTGNTTTANISNTFIYGDDFTTDTSSNYTVSSGSILVSGGILNINGVLSGNAMLAPTTQPTKSSYIVEARANYTDLGGAVDGWIGVGGYQTAIAGTDGYISQFGWWDTPASYQVDIEKYQLAHLSATTLGTIVTTNWHLIRGVFNPSDIRATYERTTTVTSTDSSYTSGKYGIRTYDANGQIDWFFVREFTTTEPSNLIGAEEITVITIPTANAPFFGCAF